MGDVYAFGENTFGQQGFGDILQRNLPTIVPALSNDTISILSSGYTFSVVIHKNGSLLSFGANDNGELGLGFLGDQIWQPTLITSWNSSFAIVDISTGRYNTLVLISSGEVYVWGLNEQGEIALGHFNPQLFPILNPYLENVKQVGAGVDYGLALSSDNKLYSWGSNGVGQLCLGNNLAHDTPTLIPSPVDVNGNFTHLVAGYRTSFFFLTSSICNGLLSSDPNVCSKRGVCVGPDTCSCKKDGLFTFMYHGQWCQNTNRSTISSTDSSVCSGAGKCVDYNVCSCNATFAGDNCEFTTCFGVSAANSSVCSAHGNVMR